ncbi:MAG: oligosaccharide flippase family protein [Chitinophagaceae bacterium]|nr:oligosaccharide flippase family protein [Chitinophagaceae bacterium]
MSFLILFFPEFFLPADFGLFAIIATFIIFFSLIKDFGLGSYLITRKK